MDDLKNKLNDILEHLEELEAAARKLVNQNFADIVKSAKGRVQQLTEHPDLEAVHKEGSGGEEMPFDPNAGTAVNPNPDAYAGDSGQKPAEVQK